MRYIISICIIFLSLFTVFAQDTVTRLEGRYTATYQFENEARHGDSWQTGTVIYYASPCKKGKPSTKYETYPDREWGTVKGDSISDRPLYDESVFSIFWPTMAQCNKSEPDSIVNVGDTTVCYYTANNPFTGDNLKAMRFMGFGCDVTSRVYVCKYLKTSDVSTDINHLISCSVSGALTGNGKWYRWLFQAPETKLRVNIDIDVTSITEMTAKEAKAARKRENAAYKQAHKKK